MAQDLATHHHTSNKYNYQDVDMKLELTVIAAGGLLTSAAILVEQNTVRRAMPVVCS